MTCIWCHQRKATQDIFCEQCYTELDERDRAMLGDTCGAACIRLGKEVEAFNQSVKDSLPRWLKWMVRV